MKDIATKEDEYNLFLVKQLLDYDSNLSTKTEKQILKEYKKTLIKVLKLMRKITPEELQNALVLQEKEFNKFGDINHCSDVIDHIYKRRNDE